MSVMGTKHDSQVSGFGLRCWRSNSLEKRRDEDGGGEAMARAGAAYGT